MPWSVTVRSNRIGQVQADIMDNTVKAVRDSAQFMRTDAQQIAPVQTGAFRASLYISGPNDESDYGQAASKALELRAKAEIVPEQKAATLDLGVKRLRDALGRFSLPQAVVSSAVGYAIFLEEGTVHMAPRPTLRPAALHTENVFKQAMGKVADV